MGQDSSRTIRPLPKELRVVDEKRGLFLNVCNDRMYLKNDLFIRNIQDVEYELEIYQFRRLNDTYVVSVDYCSNESERDSNSALSYFIEQQDYSLFDKQELRVKEGLNLLLHVLKAFEKLYDRFGYFTPSSRLVLFNRFHQPKVWMHENLRNTRNVQNIHCPHSLMLENNFVREVVKMFDALRDPGNPMFCYSKCLQAEFMTFKKAIEVFAKRRGVQVEQPLRVSSPYSPYKEQTRMSSPVVQRMSSPGVERMSSAGVERMTSPGGVKRWASPIVQRWASPVVQRWESPIIERRTSFKPKPQMNTTVSHLVSPRSPVRQTGFEKPTMKITYCSPVKVPSSNSSDQLREEVNLSLKPSKFKPRGSSRLKPSLEFTSTMPNSLKTSRVEDKSVCVEVLTSVPTNNSVPRFSLNASKRFTMQQSTETEPLTSFGKDLINHPHFASERSEKDALPRPSLAKVMMFPFEEESSRTERSDMTPVIEESKKVVKKGYKTHKRHRTDYRLNDPCNSGVDVSFNQKSLMGVTDGGKFLCNTIKSIHLLEEDREMDSSIITDLKQIINKYRLNEMKDE